MGMKLNPVLVRVLQTLGLALILTVFQFLADATNLQGLVSPATAALVSAIAVAIENSIKSSTGKSLFGTVRTA